ncbi:zinc-dependent peptidase [Achromobacter sp. Marseille-Q0513]|uniref:M90 family metallopeptidase n=1 Tax=Achromobacter sp. Marseille-Q0513 TaxID=2829161 RepID=UPI001B9ADD75|nr:M90 family metallopeptidase [Achromobacter sp. Marseille-Q0513]MBR8654903.1 zinc-dependent peptidase [Achromobacter sp. Marseille-Q0513]
MLRWLKGRGARPSAVAEMQARISPELWRQVLEAHPFLAALNEQERAQLLARSAWLLASKSINGAQGLDVTDAMRLSIAAQASLPILNLTPSLYEGWDEIIVYPSGFRIPRSRQDEDGVVHEYIEDAAGEAWDGGPVILSWEDAQLSDGGFNVVIHEFAHKLDLQAGDADGMPSLAAHPDIAPRAWRRVLDDSLDRFIAALDAVEAAIPPDMDPESEDADAWYGQLPMDPYAATDEAEFFAVSSEHFFVDPWPMRDALPEWYAMLRAYYRQDPAERLA